jgi:uncharacterized protein (TIGR02231 family)
MRPLAATILAFTLAPTLADTASAADLAVPSHIGAVTVYPDGATVTRMIEFNAPQGETTLIASDLPTSLDPASIRLDAAAAPGVTVAGVDTRVVRVGAGEPDATLEAKLESLRDARAAIDAQLAALKVKKGFIERVALSTDLAGGKDGEAAPGPDVLRTAWNAVGDDLGAVNEAMRLAEVRMRGIDRDIARLQAEQEGRPQGEERTELRITLSSDAPVNGHILVSYVVGQASWQPLYDAHLDTRKGSLEIVRRARIRQATGEDWKDVALTVSTARALAGASVPYLGSRIVSFYEPTPVVPVPSAALEAGPKARGMLDLEKRADAASPAPGREEEAPVDTGGFQSVWQIAQHTTIASGPSAKSLRLATLSVQPDIRIRAAPALAPTAFVEAVFDEPDETPLFEGPLSIYRDGLYAGQSGMPRATHGEQVRLGFGADDRIKVERSVTRKLATENGWSRATTSDRREFKIALMNGTPSAIKLSVEEALPVSETGDIKVELLPQAPFATEKNADDRRGIHVWTLDLAPGASQDIRFGYKVTWPSEMAVNLD